MYLYSLSAMTGKQLSILEFQDCLYTFSEFCQWNWSRKVSHDWLHTIRLGNEQATDVYYNINLNWWIITG